MKRLALTISGVAGLVLGLLIGAGVGAAVGQTSPPPIAVVETSQSDPEPAAGATWTYRGELAHVELPLEFEVTRDEVETDFGYQSDFTSVDGVLTIETAPRLAETTMTLADIADRFAQANDGAVTRRQVGDVETYAVTWNDADQASSQYFFTKDEMTYGLRSNAGSLDDQTVLLDSLVGSLTRNPDPEATPTATETAAPTAAPRQPAGCVGDDQVPMVIANVKKYANARDRASPDAQIVDRVPLDTTVTWTGEKLKNGRFTWHEVYYPDHVGCVWVAHTLLEQAAAAAGPQIPSETIVFSSSLIAGEPIGGNARGLIDRLKDIVGPAAGPLNIPPDTFVGPFRAGCSTYWAWEKFEVVTCDDGTTNGWIAATDSPPEIKLDDDSGPAMIHWRKLGNWPDDTTAYFRLDLERWVVTSDSLGVSGMAEDHADRPIDTSAAVPADEVLPSSTVIEHIWNLDLNR